MVESVGRFLTNVPRKCPTLTRWQKTKEGFMEEEGRVGVQYFSCHNNASIQQFRELQQKYLGTVSDQTLTVEEAKKKFNNADFGCSGNGNIVNAVNTSIYLYPFQLGPKNFAPDAAVNKNFGIFWSYSKNDGYPNTISPNDLLMHHLEAIGVKELLRIEPINCHAENNSLSGNCDTGLRIPTSVLDAVGDFVSIPNPKPDTAGYHEAAQALIGGLITGQIDVAKMKAKLPLPPAPTGGAPVTELDWEVRKGR